MKQFFLIFLLISNVHAAIPTAEGLFRNSSNPDLLGDTVVLRLGIKEIEVDQDNSNMAEEGHYKLIFYKKTDSSRVSLLQIKYKSSEMIDNNICKVDYYKNFTNSYKKSDLLERNLFYSLVSMYALNSSLAINDLLTKYGNNYQNNSDLMNKDKLILMKQYKKYLAKLKDKNVESETLISPMKPQTEKEMIKVKQTLTKNMYKNNDSVRLERKNGKFYWELQLDNIKALFGNNNHKLLFLSLIDGDKILKSYFRNYILFDGKHQLPKNIELSLSNNKKYNITFIKFNNFDSKSKTLHKRYKTYLEKLKDLKLTKVSEIIKPGPFFIL